MGISSILNPLIYINLPCIFYIAAYKDERSWFSPDFLLCYLVMTLSTSVGIGAFLVYWFIEY
jgi:hypothetical protein